MAENHTPIKAYSKKELADLYGIPVKQLAKWIIRLKDKELNKKYLKTIKLFTPAQVKRLFDEGTGLGLPDNDD